VTFGDLFQNHEYRALYSASTLSWVGDYLARAAVTALIFHTTKSVALSAAAFAVGYLPGLVAGPVLAALAERYPHRTAMVTCDLLRAGLIAIVAIRGLPVSVIFVLLFLTAVLSPPFDASRSALLPRILEGDRYVVGISLHNTTNSLAMVVGYFAGAAVAPSYPHAVLLADSVTFLASAALIARGTRVRPANLSVADRRGLFPETVAGFRLVWGSPMLRAIAIIFLGSWLFAVAPEGLAAAWASKLAHGGRSTGINQALIMMSVPVGNVIGAIIVGRYLRPSTRQALIRPLALLVPLSLVPSLIHQSAWGVAIMGAVAGFAVAGVGVPANGLFVQALPTAFRARAFGVMQFCLQFVQAATLLTLGFLADRFDLPRLVGVWSIGGVAVMAMACAVWPPTAVIDATIEEVRVANEASSHLDEHDGFLAPETRVPPRGPYSTGEITLGHGRRPASHHTPRQGMRTSAMPVHRTEAPARLSDPQT
jgi:MFS family permease